MAPPYHLLKGGIWKNTEDEILKAAVMKYGKNQWSRISSLLVRKSAKQCKARWYEWLDPSIKKIEWSREEEERLLHLVKIMPMQWRTIATLLGRTAAQCQEQYERLIDRAMGRDGTGEEIRKLRPGEIDPAPETRPAKPDPIDMDEDEKEMLAEARARLANTQGKKAKRKAREKMLEEAKKLASIQKRREMKAAGLDTGDRKRKRKHVDYNIEIPFYRAAPQGAHDTRKEKEVEKTESEARLGREYRLDQMEGPRRSDKENRQRKIDQERLKELETEDPMSFIQRHLNERDQSLPKRPSLVLPAPQVTETELYEIVKLHQESQMEQEPHPDFLSLLSTSNDQSILDSSGPSSTAPSLSRTLQSMHTSLRTPAPAFNSVMVQAHNLATLHHLSETPLLGGVNNPLHDSLLDSVRGRTKEVGIIPPTLEDKQGVSTRVSGLHSANFPSPTTPAPLRLLAEAVHRHPKLTSSTRNEETPHTLLFHEKKSNLLHRLRSLPTPHDSVLEDLKSSEMDEKEPSSTLHEKDKDLFDSKTKVSYEPFTKPARPSPSSGIVPESFASEQDAFELLTLKNAQIAEEISEYTRLYQHSVISRDLPRPSRSVLSDRKNTRTSRALSTSNELASLLHADECIHREAMTLMEIDHVLTGHFSSEKKDLSVQLRHALLADYRGLPLQEAKTLIAEEMKKEMRSNQENLSAPFNVDDHMPTNTRKDRLLLDVHDQLSESFSMHNAFDPTTCSYLPSTNSLRVAELSLLYDQFSLAVRTSRSRNEKTIKRVVEMMGSSMDKVNEWMTEAYSFVYSLHYGEQMASVRGKERDLERTREQAELHALFKKVHDREREEREWQSLFARRNTLPMETYP